VKNVLIRGLGLRVFVLAVALSLFVTNGTPRASAGVSVGSAFVIEPPMARYLRDLDQREQREQIRDWAVIATVAKLGATPGQAAAATYELPPARLPYFDELYTFEYGRGRRAYLGTRVLLFRDGDDPEPQMTIGRLADRVRMENGEIPAEVEIYLVHDQRDEGAIRVERVADADGSQLFSSAYGYVEGTVDSVSALSAWLDQADDLAFAQVDHGRVVLGGRRFSTHPASNLTPEDVAALYQAHVQLDTPRAPARAVLASLPPGARAAVERLRTLVKARASDEELHKVEDALTLNLLSGPHAEIYDAITALATPARSPGFSLDPEWLPDPSNLQHPLMLSKLQAFAADPCGALADIARRADALERAEPDDTRRTAPTGFALVVRENLSATVCPALERLVSPIPALASRVALAKPDAWESELVGYHQLVAQWANLMPEDRSPRVADDGHATGEWLDDVRRYHRYWVDYLRGGRHTLPQFLRVRKTDPLAEEPRSLRGRPENIRIRAAWVARAALEFYKDESEAQCARYVGTEGTSVGMTMFYADLLAKLWESTDYGLSAPIADVPGFLSVPRIDLDPAFLAESEKNPYTRIWFGTRASAVSKAVRGQRTSFYFDHTFSRIYAAGSNPAKPGVEVRPREDSRRTIGWWNRHFDDVASYEPEYQRLNQIMKWALVTAAFTEANVAQYLGSVQVRRNWTFSDWQQANRARLRFSESLPVSRSWPSGRECLPLLASYSFPSMGQSWSIRGGIDSVPTAALDEVAALNPSRSLGARMPHVETLAEDSVSTIGRAHPVVSGEQVEFADAAGISTRTAGTDIELGTPKVAYRAGATPREIEISVGDSQRPIGVLDAEVEANQVKLNWKDGKVELERYHAPDVPADLAAADRLAADGDLITSARSYEQNIASTRTTASELTAIDRARAVVVKAAKHHPAGVLKTMQQLEGQGAKLDPVARKGLFNAVSEVGSPGAAKHVQYALEHDLPLTNQYGKVLIQDGHIIVARDIESLPVTRLSAETPTNLSDCEVYLDTRLRVGQEGLVPEVSGSAARWQQLRNVRVETMNANEIGALPDRIVTGTVTKTTFDRVHAAPNTIKLMASPRVVFLRRCNRDGKTVGGADGCEQDLDHGASARDLAPAAQ